MSLLVSDDELVTIGDLFEGWRWALMTVGPDEYEQANLRGVRSLMIRGYLDESGAHEDLYKIARYGNGVRSLGTAFARLDGTIIVAESQLFAIAGDSDMWLVDVRLPLGIHRLDEVSSDVLCDLLVEVYQSYIHDGQTPEISGLLILDQREGKVRGLRIGDRIDNVGQQDDCYTIEGLVSTEANDEMVRASVLQLLQA